MNTENIRILRKLFLLIFLYFNIIVFSFSNLILSQEEVQKQRDEYTKTIIGYAGWWWLIFIIGIFIVIFGIVFRTKYERISKYLLYGGLICVFCGMMLAQILYVLPLIPMVGGINIYTCEKAGDLTFIQQVACIFSGIAPKMDVYAFLVWFIFLFILPLALLVSVFSEFTPSSMITNPNARKVIIFASALIAYRFLMAYLFVEFISIGLGGIALFSVNILFFEWGVSGIRKLFANIEAVKKMREIQDLAQLERLMRMREELYAAWEAAIRSGNTELAKNLEEQLKKIDEEIDKLRNSMEKKGEKLPSPPSYFT